ncbi:hypothetical protein FOZ63_016476, partial [Perkinsus olseni]
MASQGSGAAEPCVSDEELMSAYPSVVTYLCGRTQRLRGRHTRTRSDKACDGSADRTEQDLKLSRQEPTEYVITSEMVMASAAGCRDVGGVVTSEKFEEKACADLCYAGDITPSLETMKVK